MQPEFELYKQIANNDLEFLIEIKNGKPYGHPIAISNFRCLYPDIDINNLPNNYARFNHIKRPNADEIDKLYPYLYFSDEPTYRWFGTIVIQDWNIRPMTKKEILEKQTNVKNQWYDDPFNSLRWTFDEKTCSFVPPVPFPKDYHEKRYRWEDETHSWQLTPLDPIKHYNYIKKHDEEKAKAIEDILKKKNLI
jgi:hypothetical protein